MTDTNDNDTTVLLFYSSDAQPGFPDRHTESIQFCEDHDLSVRVVDIAEETETAHKYNILTTPTLVTDNNGTVHKHTGVVSGYRTIIRSDLDGDVNA